METQRKYEEDRIAKNEEIELIMNDLERANHNYEATLKQARLSTKNFESFWNWPKMMEFLWKLSLWNTSLF